MRKVAKEYIYLFWTAGVLMTLSVGASAQDPAFSQFFANPLYLNPAMAGVEGPVKLYLGYRNQWPGATNPYSTYHASYDQYIDALHGGIGAHVINDRQGGGIINTISVDAICRNEEAFEQYQITLEMAPKRRKALKGVELSQKV